MAKSSTPSAHEREQIIGMMEKEMEYRVDMFNKLTHTCFSKCIENKYKEAELNMGENSCIDRCVSKYWQVTNLVGQLLGNSRPPMYYLAVADLLVAEPFLIRGTTSTLYQNRLAREILAYFSMMSALLNFGYFFSSLLFVRKDFSYLKGWDL